MVWITVRICDGCLSNEVVEPPFFRGLLEQLPSKSIRKWFQYFFYESTKYASVIKQQWRRERVFILKSFIQNKNGVGVLVLQQRSSVNRPGSLRSFMVLRPHCLGALCYRNKWSSSSSAGFIFIFPIITNKIPEDQLELSSQRAAILWFYCMRSSHNPFLPFCCTPPLAYTYALSAYWY